MDTSEKKEIFAINRKALEEAAILGTHIVRSCSGGSMRLKSESPKKILKP